MKLFKKAKKGFTLVELVVVIAVIAILAAVSVGAYFGVTESAKNSKHEQEAKSIHTAMLIVGNEISDNHRIDENGLHIVDLETFEASLNKTTGARYSVYDSDATAVAGNAIILKNVSQTSNLQGEKTYNVFEYYSLEMGSNVAGVVDITSGSYSKEGNKNVEVTKLYTTEKEVNDAISKATGEKETLVTFGSNIQFADHLYIAGNKKVTLDLNGYTAVISGKDGITHYGLGGSTEEIPTHDTIGLHIAKGANVTLTGNGSIEIVKTACDCGKDQTCNYGVALIGVYDKSYLTIKNGTYFTHPIDGASVLYVREDGMINIEGGTFGATTDFCGTYYTFNRKAEVAQDSYKYFNITGGTFYYQNPAEWEHHGKKFNFVPKGYSVKPSKIGDDIPTYTVEKA